MSRWLLCIWRFTFFGFGYSSIAPDEPGEVLLDSQFLLKEQVVVVVRRTFAQLLCQLRSFLNGEGLLTVLVISHYCNALYVELPL